ncbi:MAG: hypothetical protein AABY22_28975, partial [Nanoarchaeota archaeon]
MIRYFTANWGNSGWDKDARYVYYFQAMCRDNNIGVIVDNDGNEKTGAVSLEEALEFSSRKNPCWKEITKEQAEQLIKINSI